MERLSTIVPALAAAGLFIAVGSSAAVAKKGKPKLYYFYGRGLGEAARFALGATGVEWDNIFIRNRAQMLELLSADRLKFQQLPLLEMPDGSTSVQSGAILRHIGRAYNLYGASDAEANLIDNLVEGIKDFGGNCPGWPTPEARAELADDVKALNEKHFPRYLGAFEKQLQLNGSGFLVGKGITIADTLLLRYIEEVFDWVADAEKMLTPYPGVASWRRKMRADANVAAFLSGPRRMLSPADEATGTKYVKEVRQSLGWA